MSKPTKKKATTKPIDENAHTLWWCERCHASGVIDYLKNESVYTVLELLASDHDEHRVAAISDCTFATGVVRVSQVTE